jgi:transcriptional regulator of acetoin/glycerol metabolism
MSMSNLARPDARVFAKSKSLPQGSSLSTATETPNYRAALSSQFLNLDAIIRYHIHFVLDLNQGNKLKTARQLGISRSTLYRMLDFESAGR